VTQGPIVDTSNTDCSNVSITSNNTAPPSNIGCSGQFVRTWTVVDSCQSPIFIETYSQVIILDDTEGPTLMCPMDQTIEIDSFDMVCETLVMLEGTATDACGLPITVTNDSPFANNPDSADATGTYEGGTTVVTVTATDVCGNQSTCTYSVSVVDVTAFVKGCDKIIASIPSFMGSVPVHIDESDALFCSICPNSDFNLSWSATDPFDSIYVATCVDVGVNPYVVHLWQGGQLIDTCESLLQILDCCNYCPPAPSPGVVQGQIFTESHSMVVGVEVDLEGSGLNSIVTENNGQYAFPAMPYGGSYRLLPLKDFDYLNGVSTADIIGIQRHILGSELLDSPYKLIAADVNNSGDVSTIDLIELRKLILGIYDELPDNRSWRMVDSGFDFVDELDPFNAIIPEDYLIYDFDQPMVVNFIGVKVGDVNNTVIANANEVIVEKRLDQPFNLVIEERQLSKGSIEQIAISAQDIATLEGFQMSLLFDLDKVDVVGFVPHLEDMSTDNINPELMLDGRLNISWNKLVDPSKNTLFSVIVQSKKDCWTSDFVDIDDTFMNAEAYQDKAIRNIKVNYVNDQLGNQEVVLYQNQPNPWSENTEIKFYMPVKELVYLTVFDVNGKVLYKRSVDAVKGLNKLNMNNSEINDSGILYYELTTGDSRKINKMILIK